MVAYLDSGLSFSGLIEEQYSHVLDIELLRLAESVAPKIQWHYVSKKLRFLETNGCCL
jgi:hypothetical protein